MSEVRFVVLGEPQGKVTYAPEKTVLYENLIAMEYLAQCGGKFFGQGVPIGVRIDCYLKQPKSKRRSAYPCKRPDVDNIMKTWDGLNGVAWYDNSQIVDAHVNKYWADVQPRIEVTIWEVGE